MATGFKKNIQFTLAGIGSGLLISAAVRLIAGFFFALPADLASLVSFGIAGIVGGSYIGFVLAHFNYDALFKHLDKTKDLT